MKKKILNNKKGAMFLILTVLVTSIILITLASLHNYINKNMSDAGFYYEETRAYAAALAGIDYARMRVEQDYHWEGDNNANDVINRDAGDSTISIDENYNGGKCVKGEIRDKANNRAKTTFYITFSYYPDISRYVSYNCIANPERSETNPAVNTTQSIIPKNGVLLVVKGESRGKIVYIESGFKLSGLGGATSPAIASRQIRVGENAAPGITPTPLPSFVVDAADLLDPSIYSRFALDSENDKSLFFNNMSVDLNGGKANTLGHYFSGLPSDSVNVGINQPVPDLNLETIKEKQLSKWPAVNTLKAGEYVVMPNGTANGKQLYKIEYRVSGADPKVYIPDEVTGVPEADDDKLTGIKMENSKLKIQEPQKVEPFGSQKNIIIRGEGLSSRVKIVMDKKGENQPYIINEGVDAGITISGELSGDGGVFANGDVTFEGKSILNTTVDNGVSVFAGGSITMNDIPATNNNGTAVTDQDTGNYLTDFRNFAKKFYAKEVGNLNASREPEIKQAIKAYVLTKDMFSDKSKSSDKRREIQSFKDELKTSTNEATRGILGKNFNIFNAWLLNGFDYEENDSVFYGLLYSRKNFICGISGKFTLFGSIIVKGDGSSGNGNLTFKNSKGVVLYYDPAYLSILSLLDYSCRIDQKYLNKL